MNVLNLKSQRRRVMIAVGNDELGAYVKKGDYVIKGALRGIVKYGTDGEDKETDLLGFITTEKGSSYLVSVNGQLLEGWEIQNERG